MMAAFTSQGEELKKPTATYQVKANAFEEKMPMISVVVKNKSGGSGVYIVTGTLRRKLRLKKIESLPFTIKMADQKKVMPKEIIQDVCVDVGGIMIWIVLTIIDMVNNEDSYSMLLGRPWLKEAQARHDWPLTKLTLTQGGNKVELNIQRTPT